MPYSIIHTSLNSKIHLILTISFTQIKKNSNFYTLTNIEIYIHTRARVCIVREVSFTDSWERAKKKIIIQLIQSELNIYVICPLTLYDL